MPGLGEVNVTYAAGEVPGAVVVMLAAPCALFVFALAAVPFAKRLLRCRTERGVTRLSSRCAYALAVACCRCACTSSDEPRPFSCIIFVFCFERLFKS